MPGHHELHDARADFRVTIPPPKMMTAKEELDLVRMAAAQNPDASEYRYRLAYLLFMLDVFDEAIDVLRKLAAEVSEFRVFQLLVTALLARETAEDSLAAKRFAAFAVDTAGDRFERSRALALLGKVHARLAETGESRDRLVEALEQNVANKDAYKRLAMLDFQAGRDQEARDYAEQMVANGVIHCRVLGVRAMALARLGRMDEAREALGMERFLRACALSPPPAWPTIEAFNRALAAELLNHRGIRRDRYGTASSHTWRIDEPAIARSPFVPELQKLIVQEVQARMAQLSEDDHPWLRSRPAAAGLHNWCVMTDGDGFEEWHVHQNGWLSGAYYVDVPDFIVEGKGAEGCIMFGLPPGIIGDDRAAAFGSRLIRPRSGLLLLFPSHAFHRTFAHRGGRRRICFAFDIAPEYEAN